MSIYDLLTGSSSCFTENYFFPINKREKPIIIETTLLHKQYKYILPISALIFLLSNSILFYVTHYDTPIQFQLHVNCFSDIEIKPQWYVTYRLFILGASFAVFCTTIVRIILSLCKRGQSHLVISAYLSGLLVMTLSFSTELIHYLGIFTTVCEDVFSVRSPVIEISEWIVTVPLMIYMNVTLNVYKKEISKADKLIITGAILNIFFGFLPIALPESLSSICILLSGICMIYYLHEIIIDASIALRKFHTYDIKSYDIFDYVEYLFCHKRLVTAIIMAMIFPLFPVTYLLSASKIFDHNITSCCFATLNFGAKCCYVLALMEDQLDIIDPKVLRLLYVKKNHAEVTKSLEKEKRLNINLLRQMLPSRVVENLRSQQPVPAMRHPAVTIFFRYYHHQPSLS